MNAPAIALENLTVTYSRHPAVHHVTGSLARGSLTRPSIRASALDSLTSEEPKY